ncbi:hypothetical protein [Teichococcus vastitatis]|uniref:ParG protein n=1 Tax=Teichococcus vastitatis TaxID=2307076 RepID=A0ABS9W860_9PROT|nr:hypothetical protein [Pseudoroseomonas vastitatis]MCI0755432.1 hypothetical protein [Pseudoroseomonas vastitatis]
MAKSKFADIFAKPVEEQAERAPERVEKGAPPVAAAKPAPEPVSTVEPTPLTLPTAMNFKLSPAAAAGLHQHQFKTGRRKQDIVAEALAQWLERNAHLIQ